MDPGLRRDRDSGHNEKGSTILTRSIVTDDRAKSTEDSALERERTTRRRRTIVDHILDGEPWPDDVVESINRRSRDTGREIRF
jgi:hypothetical protein